MSEKFRNGWRVVHKHELDPAPLRCAPWVYHKVESADDDTLMETIARVETQRPELHYNRTVEYEFADTRPSFELEFSGVKNETDSS